MQHYARSCTSFALLLAASLAARAQTAPGPVLGKPYAAVQYRADHVPPTQAAGSEPAESDHTEGDEEVRVARDAEGRVRIGLPHRCEPRPSALVCPPRVNVLFEPADQRLTLWLEGGSAGGGSTHIALKPDEIRAVETSLQLVPAIAPGAHPPGSPGAETPERPATEGVSTQDLGTQTIEGVLAQGTRTITEGPPDAASKGRPVVSTRDVWVARDLGVVIRIVETTGASRSVRGLRKITLTPSSDLFVAPTIFGVYGENRDSHFTSYSMGLLARVPVR